MATVSVRENIVKAALVALANIRMYNSYFNDIASIARVFEPSESHKLNELPAALVLDDGFEKVITGMPNRKIQVTFELQVLCYISSHLDLNGFDADVKRAICENQQLGGAVSVIPTNQIERSPDATRGFAKFVRGFDITYTASLNEGA